MQKDQTVSEMPEEVFPGFAAERHYSWVENYMEWLEGKEAREQYYALLAEEFLHLKC